MHQGDRSLENEGSDADMSDSESEEDVIEAGRGADLLQAPALDIPRVDDIPVVSRLANKTEQERLDDMDGEQQLEYKLQANREKVNKIMHNDDDQLETHFVENPYIRLRQRASQR